MFEADRRNGELLKQDRQVKSREGPFETVLLRLARCVDLVRPEELREHLRAIYLSYGLATSGDRERAIAIRCELDVEGDERYAWPYQLVLIAFGLGDRPAVINWLERVYDDRSCWIGSCRRSREFNDVLQAPEIQRLLARVKPLS